MKRWIAVILIPLMLIGCKPKNQSMDKLYAFRELLLKSKIVTFEAEITADYGQMCYTFCVACAADENGDLSFQVMQPDTISGIQGVVSGKNGHLTFDDHILAFKTVADERLTPVTAPWAFLTALRSGYITSCGKTSDGYHAIIRDTYEENPLHLEIAFRDDKPISAEIYWDQIRVITMHIHNFTTM